MSSPQTNTGAQAGLPAPMPATTRDSNQGADHNPLSQSMERLSLATGSESTVLSSSQLLLPQNNSGQRVYPSSPIGNQTPRSHVNKSPHAGIFDSRASTPNLLRKSSVNSLQGVNGTGSPQHSTSRRTSSAHFGQHPLPMMAKSPLLSKDEPLARPIHTAASIASQHFKTELSLHDGDPEIRPADTIAILHDSCYGHRYSRPRTSRAGLSTIVERPERIHASILGLSVAYVRLGGRHAEGEYPAHPKKDASKIPSIPFRIRKTTRKLPLSSPAVTNVHGTKWMEELKIMCDSAEAKLAMNGKELTRPEMTRSPDQGVPAKFHEGDLYLCSESLDAMEGALGAVCEGVDAVFNGAASGKGPHRAFVTIRPPGHHCSVSYPSGFCWLNNVHVGIAHAALNHGLTHAAMIDFDLHHGDGSQAIAWEHNARSVSLPKNAAAWKKTSIGYFSLHDINSYPCEAGDEEKVKNASLCIENAHGQNIWNVHLQPWKTEAEFWDLYQTKYSILLEKARNFLRSQTERFRAMAGPNGPKPKAAIFLSAGFDASEWESSGMQRHKVNVPTEFYAKITRDVVKLSAEEDGGVEGRVISVLEGGYSDRALSSGVLSHISGLAGSDVTPIKTEDRHDGLGYEMSSKAGTFAAGDITAGGAKTGSAPGYDAAWWDLPHLEALDALVNPAPQPEPKKARESSAPTYFSSTQSFSAKISSPVVRRSASNLSMMSGTNDGSPHASQRPPSPKPPDVYWTTAAHELSKWLIPTDRQTLSCKPEELSAEATRARRDRQSILNPQIQVDPTAQTTSSNTTRMALRGRKSAKPLPTTEEKNENEKSVPKAGRRRTVAGGAVIAAEKAVARSTNLKPEPSYTQPTKTSSRRLSLASNAGSTSSQSASASATMSNGTSHSGSNGPNVTQRRGSSQSVRPDSSMSSRGHSIPPVPLVVKKTRPTAPTTKSARAPKKNSVVENKVNTVGGGEESRRLPSLPRKQSSTEAEAAAMAAVTDPDLETLTSGMRKIKLSLTTKAQREAREQAKLAATTALSKGPAKDATKVVPEPVPEPASASMPAHNGTAAPDDEVSPVRESSLSPTPKAPSTPQMGRIHQMQEAANVPLPSSSPAAPPVLPSAPTPPMATFASATHGASNVFIPYQPEGPTPVALAKQEELHWLEPNTSTPSPMPREAPAAPHHGSSGGRSMKDMPVFSATGVIPFAAADTVEEAKEERRVWGAPATPQK
ncbi:MAG: hypothetical protein M1818_004345 [Claussenomyces sp. TS43310]|nr:MAG: hypothetical protein M1818_004345 [Claussenomyces sp. TS43310]